MQEAFSQQTTKERIQVRSKELLQLCEALGFDSEVQSISEDPESYAIFIYNDAGTLAETPEIYETLAHHLSLQTETFTYVRERWKDTIPYLKAIPH